MRNQKNFKLVLIISIFGFIISSCLSNKTDSSNKGKESVDTVKTSEIKSNEINGYQFLEKYPIKKVPLKEQTNFDNFGFGDSLSKAQIKALKLEQVATEKNINFWINYNLKLSENYKTLVVCYMPSESELYTIMINYDTNYNIIDYDTVAYDEIAESCFRTESKIKNGKIEVTEKNFCPDISDNPEKETIIYEINENGIITASH